MVIQIMTRNISSTMQDSDAMWYLGVKLMTQLFLTLNILATVQDRDMVSTNDLL